MSKASERYVLDVDSRGRIPRFVGPFSTRQLAERWALDCVPDESWQIVPVADPDTVEWALAVAQARRRVDLTDIEAIADPLSGGARTDLKEKP